VSLAPSTCYYRPRVRSVGAMAEGARLVARIREIRAEFPRHGHRRVAARLKAEGRRANHERVGRITGEQDLRARPERRFTVTTDGDHDGPIFPNPAGDLAPTGPGWRTRPPSAS
jgi:putative transposase